MGVHVWGVIPTHGQPTGRRMQPPPSVVPAAHASMPCSVKKVEETFSCEHALQREKSRGDEKDDPQDRDQVHRREAAGRVEERREDQAHEGVGEPSNERDGVAK